MKFRFVFLFLLFSVSCGKAREIINNSDLPINKDAGRTVFVEKVLGIEDDGENSVFNGPGHLRTIEDGSLVFLDSSFLYKFGRDGQFIFKTLKRGEGPGECIRVSNYIIQADIIRVLASSPRKVLDYDLDGHYLQETRVKERINYSDFLDIIDRKIYCIRDEVTSSGSLPK